MLRRFEVAARRNVRAAAYAVYCYGLSRENAFGAALRLRSNESPGGAFKQASGLRQQMEGPCPDKRRGRDKHENKKYNTLKDGRAQRSHF